MINYTVSAIVPIYNEEKTVSGVVETLLNCPYISEVICVNDGSTDASLKKLKRFNGRIHLVSHSRNHGKGNALASGIKKAAGDIVLFLDADLIGLKEIHVNKLVKPLVGRKWKGTVGLTYGLISGHFAGQRAYLKQNLIPYLDEISRSRYGVEVLLDHIFKVTDIKKVDIKGVKDIQKFFKPRSNYMIGSRAYLQAGYEIAIQIAKNEGLLPKERLEIKKALEKVRNIKELRQKVKDLRNRKIRFYFEKYILSYFK